MAFKFKAIVQDLRAQLNFDQLVGVLLTVAGGGPNTASWGCISAAGVKLAGTPDWTVTKLGGTGLYQINWVPVKANSNYAIIVSTENTPSGVQVPNWFSKSTGTVGIQTFASSTGANNDASMCFVAFDAP